MEPLGFAASPRPPLPHAGEGVPASYDSHRVSDWSRRQMPMMFGFAEHRRQLLEAEAARFAVEAPPYGAIRAWIVGELARGAVTPETDLELVIVQDTDEPFQRRGEFWESHLRPKVGTRYL